MLKRAIKAATRRLGLFPFARGLYRRLHPGVRRARAGDIEFFQTIIPSGALVFDIGANLGQKSEVFLACGARVIALEPNPLCAPTLRFECARDRNWTLVEKAVGAEPGRARLNFVGTDSTASLRKDWSWLTESGHLKAREVEVEVTTLDALIKEFGAPDYCKIDVEGFEIEVLKGLSRPLPLVSFEYHREEAGRIGACLERLESLSPIAANLIKMNDAGFLLEEWLAPAALMDRVRAGGLPSVGDIFVCGRGASIAHARRPT